VAHATNGRPCDALRHAEAAIRTISGHGGHAGELAGPYQVAAAALQELGRREEASAAWCRAVECAPDPSRRCTSLIGLGEALRARGRFDDAEACLQHVLAVSTHAQEAADPPLRALALNTLGTVCTDVGRYHEASAAFAEARRALTDRYGPDHTLVASVWRNIAGLAHARGQLLEAESAAQRAVRIHGLADGVGHRLVALDLAVLGAALAGLQRTADAERCFERAVDIHRARAPADRYEVAANLASIAAIRARGHDLVTAGRLLRDVIAVKGSILGARHPEVLRHEQELAAIGAAAGGASAGRRDPGCPAPRPVDHDADE
jgi:tetratricopeptide (TPR) repeat protein